MNNNNRPKQKVNSPLSKSNNKYDHSEIELNEPTPCNVEQRIDISQLQLFPRMWYIIKFSAKKTYSVCNLAGEKLAWFFGITKPKYHAEIQYYERMNEEERVAWRQAFQDVEHISHIRDSIVQISTWQC
ncbi:unnamed protein product [Rotaria sp. Silwood1]|nr:unnamed protein product [Rotaria sp. Silwood1]CAF3423171.1 unnamed protein product [Rotaria sp. Silwood1]CAF4523307.1 unnamed protein product [Rotaria sp. Silwood1]CAF4557392.1 unnamed protein product [Rotaria sp. Silwood1]